MNYSEMPLCGSPLNDTEKAKLNVLLDGLIRFLGAPGDWGYDTKLGTLAQTLPALRAEINRVPT